MGGTKIPIQTTLIIVMKTATYGLMMTTVKSRLNNEVII
jgi:hypothetical protein